MSDGNKSLLNLVNASGFLFQIKIEREITKLLSRHDSNWSVVASEHRWIDPYTGNENFIDMILESHAGRMVVETKRVQDAEWVFLVGDGKMNMSRARLFWTYLSDNSGPFTSWDEFKYSYSSPESSFCIVRGQGEGDRPMLERLSGMVLRSVEVIADQELSFGSNRPYGPARIYFPVIITNAMLRICKFLPDEINLETGTLLDAEFEAVPVVRFRKSLSTTMKNEEDIASLSDLTETQQRTVIIINSNNLASILPCSELHSFGYGGFPWEEAISKESSS